MNAGPMRPDLPLSLPVSPSLRSVAMRRVRAGWTGGGGGQRRRVMRWSQPAAANIFFSVSSARRVVLVPERSD